MTGTDKLRKENQSLRYEIANLKAKLQTISENLTKMEEQHGRRPDEREMSPGRVRRERMLHVEGSEQGSRRCFGDITYCCYNYVCDAGYSRFSGKINSLAQSLPISPSQPFPLKFYYVATLQLETQFPSNVIMRTWNVTWPSPPPLPS